MRSAGAMILAAALFAGAARADVVVLEDGSEREGRVVRQDEKEVVLEVAAGKIKMELVLKRSEVRSIRKGRTANEKLLAEMKKRRSRLNNRNAAGWLAYARWLDRLPRFCYPASANETASQSADASRPSGIGSSL